MSEEPLTTEATSVAAQSEVAVTWTASEFVAHHKSTGWYVLLAIIGTIISAVVYFVTKDFVSVSVIVVGAIMFGVYGSHQPRQLQYQVDQQGVTIADKFYGYQDFKSFSVIPEGAFSSIVFMPLKRFSVSTTIYYAPDDEEKILNLLSTQLPLEPAQQDAIDRLMRRIRF